jgi:hypothetical protein
LLAPFGAAASQHFTPVSVAHALTETMLFLAMNLFGLIGTFHNEIAILSIEWNEGMEETPGSKT